MKDIIYKLDIIDKDTFGGENREVLFFTNYLEAYEYMCNNFNQDLIKADYSSDEIFDYINDNTKNDLYTMNINDKIKNVQKNLIGTNLKLELEYNTESEGCYPWAKIYILNSVNFEINKYIDEYSDGFGENTKNFYNFDYFVELLELNHVGLNDRQVIGFATTEEEGEKIINNYINRLPNDYKIETNGDDIVIIDRNGKIKYFLSILGKFEIR